MMKREDGEVDDSEFVLLFGKFRACLELTEIDVIVRKIPVPRRYLRSRNEIIKMKNPYISASGAGKSVALRLYNYYSKYEDSIVLASLTLPLAVFALYLLK